MGAEGGASSLEELKQWAEENREWSESAREFLGEEEELPPPEVPPALYAGRPRWMNRKGLITYGDVECIKGYQHVIIQYTLLYFTVQGKGIIF